MIQQLLLYAALPGAVGGFLLFLQGVKYARIKNDRHLRKACLETVGGMLVAIPVAYAFVDETGASATAVLLAFAAGLGWSLIIQILRRRITRIIEAAVGVLGERGQT